MGVFEANAYIFNNEFPGGEVVVISTQCNGDAIRYEDISEKTQCEIYLDRIRRTSQCRLRHKEECMGRQSWTGSQCGSWDGT
jgi:cytochrome b involved in lipid metabolism